MRPGKASGSATNEAGTQTQVARDLLCTPDFLCRCELLARKSFAVAETQTDPGSPRFPPGAAAARAPSPWRGLSEEPTWSAVADLVQSPPPALAPLKEPRPPPPAQAVRPRSASIRVPEMRDYASTVPLPVDTDDVWGFGKTQHAAVEDAVRELGVSIAAERNAIQQVRHRAQLALRARP